jgi:hypothetical protein
MDSPKVVSIKFDSFDDYVQWALDKLETEIPGLSVEQVIEDLRKGSYRLKTYAFLYGAQRLNIDFEMESDFEWCTGNKQEDPDWVYSPAKQQYEIWGGVARLSKRLQEKP